MSFADLFTTIHPKNGTTTHYDGDGNVTQIARYNNGQLVYRYYVDGCFVTSATAIGDMRLVFASHNAAVRWILDADVDHGAVDHVLSNYTY
jgi:hypothetical protein